MTTISYLEEQTLKNLYLVGIHIILAPVFLMLQLANIIYLSVELSEKVT